MKKYIYLTLSAALLIGASSCEKLLELDPPTNQFEEDEALNTKEDLQEFLNSVYDVTANIYNGRLQNSAELLSDNLEEPLNNNDYKEIYIHNVLFFNTFVGNVYGDPYIGIYRANRILELYTEEKFALSPSELQRFRAECLFLRGILHWETVRLWAQPYGYSPNNDHLGIVYRKDSRVDQLFARGSVAENYSDIISDLEAALAILPDDNGVYATKDAARGYLAKVYFTMGDYTRAAQYATDVISRGYTLHPSVDRMQNNATSEAVFSTVSTFISADENDIRSTAFTNEYGNNNNTNPQLRVSQAMYDTYAADTNDLRVSELMQVLGDADDAFVKLTKFRRQYFDVPVINLTDLKLLRAEALALAGDNLSTAIADVNDIRERAYGGTINNLGPTATAADIVQAARYERRIEMIGEGDRIHQLKRRGGIEGETIEIRGDDWNCNGMILQFPATERTNLFVLNPTGGCQ